MVLFSKLPRVGFRVFNKSGIARPLKKQQPLEFCKKSNGHHPSKNCFKEPSCGNCGSTNHTEELCTAFPTTVRPLLDWTFTYLAFNNISETMAWACSEECMTSDHLLICGFVRNHKASTSNSPTSNGKLRVSKANLPQFARVVAQLLPSYRPISTAEEIDEFTQDINLALGNALKAVGKQPNEKSGKSAPWWMANVDLLIWTTEMHYRYLSVVKRREYSELQ
ncbi:putative eka-like protein [Erysiphe necator]|uniref:Putative eka-like protein n=1 Tax=Uncinula necator TaxID=52586 RepID=A0A0B1NUK1_UNCNE|nr:putative eka-like protein [Erysiphe necator]